MQTTTKKMKVGHH